MEEIKIYDADQSILKQVQKQRIHAYREYAKVLPEDHWNALKATLTSNVDQQPNVDVIIAEINEEMVGSVVLFPAKVEAYEFINQLEYPEIRMLAVSPEARGKGVALALIKECMTRVKARHYASIGLHTGDFMKDAIQLYEKLGFKRLPEFDFEPANDGIIVKAYIYRFDQN
ncbi:GNAT family N-acetyltransferase [Salirhabdus salicampi]|uniref:GNAT family N-acetyltransferase n=1 Tax=Salirhabdus salicampi TaxID=476102 RepID=UPI0020C49273|nr:GNAT family N-acetyltransferase [Salirhabdus salicampi]MCP8617257.1 GNAT family N-acetyltransferase [Salirhabdus salicampi]